MDTEKNNRKEREREDLRWKIQDAFTAVPYPGDDKIAPHKCDDCAAIAAFLKGVHWTEWEPKLVEFMVGETGPDDISPSLLDPVAWRFYLPGFLLVILFYQDTTVIGGSTFINDLLLNKLKPSPAAEKNFGGEDDYGHHFGLDREQLQAVHDFLLYLRRYYPNYDYDFGLPNKDGLGGGRPVTDALEKVQRWLKEVP